MHLSQKPELSSSQFIFLNILFQFLKKNSYKEMIWYTNYPNECPYSYFFVSAGVLFEGVFSPLSILNGKKELFLSNNIFIQFIYTIYTNIFIQFRIIDTNK